MHTLHVPATMYTFFEIFSCQRVLQFIDSFLKYLYNFVWSKQRWAILSPFFESLALLRIKTKAPIASSYMGQHINIMLFSQSYAATLPFCENVVCHSTLFVVFELS